MPRGKKAQTSYGKALRSPGQRSKPRTHPAHKVPMNKPKGLSTLAEYVEEQRELSGLSTAELIREFQEDWCDHTRQRIEAGASPTKRLMKCPDCGHIKEVKKKAKRKEIQPQLSEKRIREVIKAEDEKAEKKFLYAKRILDANGPELNDTVGHMVEILGKHNDNPKLKIGGVYVECNQNELRAINRKIHFWVAVRLLVAAAEWDTKISGFKFPKKRCARCGKKVK
jgi:rRNA maturation endonuclease Nob1